MGSDFSFSVYSISPCHPVFSIFQMMANVIVFPLGMFGRWPGGLRARRLGTFFIAFLSSCGLPKHLLSVPPPPDFVPSFFLPPLGLVLFRGIPQFCRLSPPCSVFSTWFVGYLFGKASPTRVHVDFRLLALPFSQGKMARCSYSCWSPILLFSYFFFPLSPSPSRQTPNQDLDPFSFVFWFLLWSDYGAKKQSPK